MRRTALPLPAAALALVSFLACATDATSVAATREEASATYVLRRVDGQPLPARVHVSPEGYTELLADTVRLGAGGVASASGAARVVDRTSEPARDTVIADVRTRRFTRDGDRVRLTPGGICDDGDALVLCVPPDTGVVRGDSLILALEMPGAARRAYVRVVDGG